jgi:hypothetical protein
MNTENTPSWEIILAQNVGKQRAEVPDFTGEAHLGANLYDDAAWFGTIGRGANKGRPYVGLQLTSQGSASSQKVVISLWEKVNRLAPAGPHFKTREQLNGQDLKFSAWVEPVGSLHRLRIVIEPFMAGDSNLSKAALETQKRLRAFVQEAQQRLPGGGQQLELDDTAKNDVEPDHIPF